MNAFSKKVHAVCLLFVTAFSSAMHAQLAYPDWWLPDGEGAFGLVDDSFIGTEGYPYPEPSPGVFTLPESDFGIALLGQAKHMVSQTKLALDEIYADYGGAGPEIDALVNKFSYLPLDNHLSVAQGQLKYLLDPVYARLAELGYPSLQAPLNLNDATGSFSYPFQVDQEKDSQALTIGQLKYAFNLDLVFPVALDPDGDVDRDGLKNSTEDAIITAFGAGGVLISHIAVTATGDADGDGLNNLSEQQHGTDSVVQGTPLPFSDDFETGFSGWLLSPGTIVVMEGPGAEGSLTGLKVEGDSSGSVLAREFSDFLSYDLYYREIWVDFYVKADAGGDLPRIEVAETLTLDFETTLEGGANVIPYSGYSGKTVSGQPGRGLMFLADDGGPLIADVAVWQRITLRIDYRSNKWALHCNGQFVAADLGFSGDASEFSGMTFSAGASDVFYLDRVNVNTNKGSLVLEDTDGDGVPDVDENGSTAGNPDNFDTDFDGLSDLYDLAPGDWDLHSGFTQTPLSIGFESDEGYVSGALCSTEADGSAGIGQQNWMVMTDAEGLQYESLVQIEANSELYSEYALVLDNVDLTSGQSVTASLPIAAAGEESLAISYYAKFQSRILPGIIETTGRVYHFELDSTGILQIWDGENGVWIDHDSGEDLRLDWHLYAVELDFQTRTYDLYLDDTLIQEDLHFLDPSVRWLTEFSITHYAPEGGPASQLRIDNLTIGRTRQQWDHDNDGLLDVWEMHHFGDLYQYGTGDADLDGRSNLQEFDQLSDPNNAKENGDGIPDGISLSTPVVQSPLPFAEDFESYSTGGFSSGSGNWFLDGGAVASVVNGGASEGAQSLQVSASVEVGRLSHYFDSAYADEIWIDYYLKTEGSGAVPSSPPVVTNSAAFCFNDVGELYYYNGKRSRWFSGQATIAPDSWFRVTVHQNFVTQQWSLYLDGTRILFDEPFSNPAPWFYNVSFPLVAGEAFSIDNVRVQTARFIPDNLDDDADGLTNEEETASGADPKTDPDNWDTDGDNISDGIEMAQGSDPLDANSTGDYVNLPIRFDFEDLTPSVSLDGQDGWSANGATVVPDSDMPDNQVIQLDDTGALVSMVHPIAPSNVGRKIFIRFDAWLQPWILSSENFDLIDVSGIDAEKSNLLIALDSAGRPAVFDGINEQWKVATEYDLNLADGWHHYQIVLDTFTRSWSLVVDDILVFESIPVRDQAGSAFYFWGFYFRGADEGNAALIDNVSLSYDPDTRFDADYELPLLEFFTGYTGTDLIVADENVYWTLEGAGATATFSRDVDPEPMTDYDGDGIALELTAGVSEDAVLRHSFAPHGGFVTARFAIQPTRLATGQSPHAPSKRSPVDYYFDDSGSLHVSSGESWVVIDEPSFVSSSWYTLAFVFNINNQTWRLDVDDRTVAKNLEFTARFSQLDEFVIVNRSTNPLRVDALTIRKGAPPLITIGGVSRSSESATGQHHFMTGTYLKLRATARDVDATADVSVEFYDAAGTLLASDSHGEMDEYAKTFVWNSAGVIDICAKATDSDGFSVLSKIVSITVSDDSDNDELPDAWEALYFDPTTQTGTDNADDDGIDNMNELRYGSNPIDYYNTGHPSLEIIPHISITLGNTQAGTVGSALPEPITITIRDQDDELLVNAPFTLDASAQALLFDFDADPSDGARPISGTTGSDGTATFTVQP